MFGALDEVRCPFCAESIPREAYRCAQCTTWLVPWGQRHLGFVALIHLTIGGTLLWVGWTQPTFAEGLPRWLPIGLGALWLLYGIGRGVTPTDEAYEAGRERLLARMEPSTEAGEHEDVEDPDAASVEPPSGSAATELGT